LQSVNHTEREFGVLFPGTILPPEKWTQSALKRYPEGRMRWLDLFGRASPVVIDIGCGNGRFLIGSAIARTDHDHLGLDTLPVVIRYARKRANQRGTSNIKFAVGNGRELLADHVEPATVSEIHCYHPQPYYDPAHVHRRLITPQFLALVHQSLLPGGLFVVQSDNPGYWRYIREVARVFFEFQEQPQPWPDAPRGRTRREIIARSKGLPIFRGIGTARLGLGGADAVKLAESMPPPVFDADRRLRQIDELE
jgi:tRNA (guanine-N7-)-methyltransferase